jgi:hypothetical protein
MAIAHGNDTAAQNAASATSYTLAHNLSSGSGNNRLLIVVGSIDLAGPPTLSCTYNGVSMNALTMQMSNSVQNRIFYLLDADLPASSGNYNIILSTTSAGYLKIIASDFTGVFQDVPDSQAGNAVNAAAITVDIETFADESLVYVGAGNASSSSLWSSHEANYTTAGEITGGSAHSCCATWRVEPTAGWKSPTDTSNTLWYLSSVAATWPPADEALNISFTPETLAVSDSLSVKRGGNLVSVSDSLSLADSISKMTVGQVKVALAFALGLAEGLTVKPGTVLLTLAAETVGLADSVLFQSAKTVQVYDSIVMPMTQAIVVIGQVKYQKEEGITLDEEIELWFNPSAYNVYDTLSISEEVIFEHLIIVVQVADSLVLAEQVAKYYPPLTKNFAETLSISGSVAIAYNPINIVVDEDLLFADQLTMNFSRGLNTLFHFTALTGGAAGAMDSIDGGSVIDGDRAFCIVASVFSVWYLDEDYGGSDSATVVSPDTNAGSKRWRKCTVG